MRYNGFRPQAPQTDWGQRLPQDLGEGMDGGFWQQPQSYPPMSDPMPPEMGQGQDFGKPTYDASAYGQSPSVDELGRPYAQEMYRGEQPSKVGLGQMMDAPQMPGMPYQAQPMGGKPFQPEMSGGKPFQPPMSGGKPFQGLRQMWQKPIQPSWGRTYGSKGW